MEFYNFEDIKDQIEDGDIIFIKGKWNSIPQSLIMLSTRSKIYHVGIAFWMNTPNDKHLMIVEATGKSARRIVNLRYYEHCKISVIKAVVPWKEMEHAALEKIGLEGYGFVEAAYIGIRETFFRWFGVKLPFVDLPLEVCSSFVARLLKFQDYVISPQKLYDRLLGMSDTRKKAS